MRCKNCRHFTRAKEGIEHSCNSPKFVYEDIKEDDQLGYWDYEGYSAGFNVGENFGCIHFEAIAT